jgi:hypothetical protein
MKLRKMKRKKKKMDKCPACGFKYNRYPKATQIRDLLFQRDKDTKKTLKKVIGLIRENIPSEDTDDKTHKFLWGLKDIENKVILWGIKVYISSNMHLSAKGFAFLRAIIQNHAKDRKALEKAELKKLGKTPKSLKIKRKELGYDK